MQMQQAQQPAQAGFFSPKENAPQEQESFENEQENAFSIDSNQVESAIKDQVDDRQEKDLDQLLDAGNDLLFGKDTHYQLMDQLQNSKDIGTDLGGGGFSLMTMLIKESGGTIPGDIILPAGVILLARAAEFLNESGIAKVTDDDFEKATHLFSVQIMNTFDPDFKSRMQQSIGDQGMPQQPEQGVPQEQPDMQQQQSTGLLGR